MNGCSDSIHFPHNLYTRDMCEFERFDHILIRDRSVMVRVPKGVRDLTDEVSPKFFDVRTGVQLKAIFPELQGIELRRGRLVPPVDAAVLLRSSTDPRDFKIVDLMDVKQRKLDTVVADSILDQLRIVRRVLDDLLKVADKAGPEERHWLAQQTLTLVRKFSGRELEEFESIVEWFNSKPGK